MKIKISTQILDGNLGDGWTNNYAAAQALADYTKQTWLDDLSDYTDHEINIGIDVERNTSGASRDVEVDVTGDDFETAMELESEIEKLLTDENTIWSNFCSSNKAEEFCVDD